MLRSNKTILDKNVAATVEKSKLKNGKMHMCTSSSDTHLGLHAEVVKKGDEISVQRNYYDMMPGGKVKMGIKDTKEKISA